jgi:hypothetical protein
LRNLRKKKNVSKNLIFINRITIHMEQTEIQDVPGISDYCNNTTSQTKKYNIVLKQ